MSSHSKTSVLPCPFARMCRLSALVLTALVSCVGNQRVDTDTRSDTGVVIVAKVKNVSALPSGETVRRKRWRVELEVLQIEQGWPSVKVGDLVAIQVHSVVKTFLDDTSSAIGRSYLVAYDDAFADDYAGNVTVTAVPRNEDSGDKEGPTDSAPRANGVGLGLDPARNPH